MKKLMSLAAIAAMTGASCAKIEDSAPVKDVAVPIGFSNYTPRSLTKASSSLVNSGALPAGSTIGVYGYSTETTNFPATTSSTMKPTFMTNLPVAYTSTSATATATDPVRYWPKTTTNLLTFFAYYPYNDATITSKPTNTTNALGTFGFTQTSDVTTMVDFMISDVANDYYYDAASASNTNGQRSNDGSVPFTLRHMLSKVNFKFAKSSGLDGVEIKVTSASIAGVLASGTITPSYAPTTAGSAGNTSFADTWATASTEYASAVTIPIASEAGSYLILSESAALNSNTGTQNNFLFVPQTLEDAVIVTINYDLTQGTDVTHNTATVQLNTGSGNPTEWERNSNIVYTFTFGLTPITFTATVVNWADETPGSFSI